MTLVVASLVERSIAGVSDSSRRAFAQGADLVEVRLDYLQRKLSRKMLAEVREAVNGPAIATLRSRSEGGRSKLHGTSRRNVLENVLESGFEYVDLELSADKEIIERVRSEHFRAKTIVSAHSATPISDAEAEARLKLACASGDIGKVAVPCDDASCAVALARIGLRESEKGRRFVIIGMGDQGQLTRACAARIGSEMVYACMAGRPAAAGQLTVPTQKTLLSSKATVLGLVGHPVSHSVSKVFQEMALKKAGLSGIYLALDFPPGTFGREALETLRSVGFKGLNITIPYKKEAFTLCDKTGPEAKATKAVNTIKFADGIIFGENTDVFGFSKMIESKKCIANMKKALVLGAGGAATSIVHVLKKEGVTVDITSRSYGSASSLADATGSRAARLESLMGNDAKYDLVVNCTPAGTRGSDEEIRLPPSVFRKGGLFIDLVYNPPETKLMRLAKRSGARAANGLDMLVHQGAEAFRIWTGIEPDVKAMASAARRALR